MRRDDARANVSTSRKKKRLSRNSRLLVDPSLVAALVGGYALGEPEADLVLRGLDGVGAVDHVAAELDAEVTADGAGLGGAVVGRSVKGDASVSVLSRRAIEKANWRRSAIEIKRGTERDARGVWFRGTYRGLVAPMILRPVLTTSLPSQTMHTTGPEHM